MATATIRLKCTGINLNDVDKKNHAQFSNEHPGDSGYSYLHMPTGGMSFEVGKVYTFTVEGEDENKAKSDKYGLP